jgi:multimeric flavodoxin WrbA
MKKLLIVYHSQSGNTRSLANSVLEGAREEEGVEVKIMMALQASLEDLLWCDGLLLGTPENFGFMSGALKDFFDRTYYPAQPYALNIPYALFVSAGNDGTGAVRQVERIVKGYPMRKIAEPVIIRGEVTEADLARCAELGLTFAAGLGMGIF